MGPTQIAPGDVVYLLTEIRTGDRIHEIGTRARVVAAAAATLTLELGAPDPGTVSCPRDHVALAAHRRAHVRTGRVRAFRPATV